MVKARLKRVMALVLVFALTFGSMQATAAYTVLHNDKAETLKTLGLFLGTATGFNLDKICTRAEGAVMLVRLLGKEEEAKNNTKNAYPFKDVPSWADRYVAYLYANNLTKGKSAEVFGSNENMTYKQYITFILRSLGYSDTNGDFDFNACDVKAAEISLLTSQEIGDIRKTEQIYRDNVVLISYKALFTNLKGSENTLLDKLYKTDSAISSDKLEAASANDAKVKEYLEKINKPLTATEIYNKVSPAVVYIQIADEAGDLYSGSGFIVSPDGVIVTNYHVIEGWESAVVKLLSGKVYPVKKVLAYDEDRDLAALKIDAEDLPCVVLGDSDKVQNGERIYAIGNPLGLEGTISEGLVSNRSRVIDGQTYIQISAPISPGSSGGALINERGEVIGVTTGGFVEGQNLNVAVPINDYKKLMPEVEKALEELDEEPTFEDLKDYEAYLQREKSHFYSPTHTIIFDVLIYTEENDPNYAYIYFIPKTYADIDALMDYVKNTDRSELEQYVSEIAQQANVGLNENIVLMVVIIKDTAYQEYWPKNSIGMSWLANEDGGWTLIYPISILSCKDGEIVDLDWYDE